MKFAFEFNIFEKPSNLNQRPDETDEEDYALWVRSVSNVGEFFFQQK